MELEDQKSETQLLGGELAKGSRGQGVCVMPRLLRAWSAQYLHCISLLYFSAKEKVAGRGKDWGGNLSLSASRSDTVLLGEHLMFCFQVRLPVQDN